MVWLKAWESIRVYENHMKAFCSMHKGVILMVFVSVVPFLSVRVLGLAYDHWKMYENCIKAWKTT